MTTRILDISTPHPICDGCLSVSQGQTKEGKPLDHINVTWLGIVKAQNKIRKLLHISIDGVTKACAWNVKLCDLKILQE